MNNATDIGLTSTVSVLSDQVLLAQTRKLARVEQVLQITVLDHLREIDARRLYLRRGYSSLFDYAVRELAVPDERIRALGDGRWKLKVVIDAECQRGLDQLRALLSHVDPHLTVGQLVGRLVREGLDRYDPGRPRRGRRNSERSAGTEEPPSATPEPEVPRRSLTSAAKRAAYAEGRGASAVTQCAWPTGDRGHSTPSVAPPDAPPTGNRSPRQQRPSEAKPSASPTGNDSRQQRRTSAAKPGEQPSRSIPVAARREVWRRDRGRCSYVDRHSGRRCGSRFFLEIDHIDPYALGGSAEPDNLRLLCGAHHRHRHAHRGAPSEFAERGVI